MATVLRVRRKRTSDPVESLVFACSKKARATADGSAAADGGGDGGVIAAAGKDPAEDLKKVFKFAGTVGKKDEPISSQIEEAIKKASEKPPPAPSTTKPKSSSKTSSKSKSKAKSKSKSREKSRSSQQRAAQARRFQVLSSHRGVDLAELDGAPQAETPKKAAPVKRTPSKLKLWNRLKKTTPAADASAEEDEAKKLFCLYDMVQEEGMTNGQSQQPGCTSPDKKAPIANPDVILCNSVQMVREKLKIEEGAREVDYVYDIYYIEEGQVDLNGALEGSPDQEVLLECLMPDSEEVEETYEDDSDSNDEGNWRNDYPEDEPDKRHPDLFDELIDDYCYGDQSSDEDFGQYSDAKKRAGNKMLNYNTYGGSDDDLGCYS